METFVYKLKILDKEHFSIFLQSTLCSVWEEVVVYCLSGSVVYIDFAFSQHGVSKKIYEDEA